MTNTYSVGGSVDSWCTKCKLELGHTIVAMVENVPKRVKCDTCSGVHNFRPHAPDSSRKKTSKTTVKRKPRGINYNELLTQLTGGDLSGSRNYTIQGNFEKEDIIKHSSFGTGIVLAVIHRNKIEALFEQGTKLLVQNHG